MNSVVVSNQDAHFKIRSFITANRLECGCDRLLHDFLKLRCKLKLVLFIFNNKLYHNNSPICHFMAVRYKQYFVLNSKFEVIVDFLLWQKILLHFEFCISHFELYYIFVTHILFFRENIHRVFL